MKRRDLIQHLEANACELPAIAATVKSSWYRFLALRIATGDEGDAAV